MNEANILTNFAQLGTKLRHVEASNVINDPKCNKGPKCNKFWP